MKEIVGKKEKKVEYIELIYDLIFVYIIGRNNLLMHNLTDGFVDGWTFFNYLLCTLAVIQMWTLTTYYINLYGRNGVRDHVMMFVNMFLLYFIGEGTRTDWQEYHTQYHAAWALILINIALQYVIELRQHRNEPEHRKRIFRMSTMIFGEAALVIGAIFEFIAFKTSYLSAVAVVASIVCISLSGRKNSFSFVDFSHLSERAMLYVVFTFGEMIIAVASYFDGKFSLSSLYFSAMAFLIATGLFLSYGVFYDRLIDREKQTNGMGYMILHIFIIFALNNVTTALEFMRNEEVDLLAKILFITLSLILYYACLLLTGFYAKSRCAPKKALLLVLGGGASAFAAGMVLLRTQMYLNILWTTVFVFAVFLLFYRFAKKAEKNGCNEKANLQHYTEEA